jgi:histidinol dehydrogenase
VPLDLDATKPGFDAKFKRLLGSRDAHSQSADAIAAKIVADVKKRGDAALVEYTNRFDRMAIKAADLRIRPAEIAAALKACAPATVKALELAASRIAAYHAKQHPTDAVWKDKAGLLLGWRWTPIDAVGLYVPGGQAAYPSSVLMNAVPAKVAGVPRLVVVVPTPDGKLNPLVLAACKIAGVDEIYRVGGAQAVAALAYGTKTIAAVDKITGPGNAYVAAAKRLVFGTVGIDLIAGPSEVVVVADGKNDPRWIAVDLLAQAEHDEAAQSILISDDAAFIAAVNAAVLAELKTHPRRKIATASWRKHGATIRVAKLDDCVALIDRLAPEHLQLAVAAPERLAARVRHVGAIFLGRYAPEALGDYLAGPNHVLPTSRAARFSSGLGVDAFVKRTTLMGADAAGLRRLAPAGIALAEAEGLASHAASIALRAAAKRG